MRIIKGCSLVYLVLSPALLNAAGTFNPPGATPTPTPWRARPEGPSRGYAVETSTPTPRPAPARPRPKVKMTQAEAEALLKETTAAVERIRGLKFKKPVTMQIIDGAGARAQFKSKIEPREEEQMKYTQEVYVKLGLVPRGTDLLTSFLDLAEEGVDGYYEPGAKVFYLLDHVSVDHIKPVMVHELTHALEDQYYDLKAISKLASGDDDRSTAISALIEGSAMVVMLSYMDQEMRKGRTAVRDAEEDQSRRAEKLKMAPTFMQRSLMMPYILGFSFLLRGHPWNFYGGGLLISDLEYAYAHPPMSTRHIIHPGLYWQRPDIKFTPPKLPDLSKILGEGWSKATEGSIGELGLAVMTGTYLSFDDPKIILPSHWSNQTSVGTVGDVFHQYMKGDERVTVFVSGWESARKAQDFAKTLKPSRGRRDYLFGGNHLMLFGNIADPEKVDKLATAAFEGANYWPHDEGVGKWPPDHGPEFFLD
jgi:hypothetical protein